MKEHFQIKDRFFDIICKNPSRDGFVTFVKESCGEQDNIDFKEKWIEKSKLAKIMLAIANSGGGMVVIGIKDNKGKGYEPIGIIGILSDTHGLLRQEVIDAFKGNGHDR